MSLAKKIRDLERLIRNPRMPEELKKKKRPELERLKAEAESSKKKRAQVEKEKKYAKKYRYLKFIEKKKVTKALNRARNKLSKIYTTDGEMTIEEGKLRAEIGVLERDLEYIIKYPKGYKYVSLYPNGGVSEEHAKRIYKMRTMIHGGTADSGGSERRESSRNNVSKKLTGVAIATNQRPGKTSNSDDEEDAQGDSFFVSDQEEEEEEEVDEADSANSKNKQRNTAETKFRDDENDYSGDDNDGEEAVLGDSSSSGSRIDKNKNVKGNHNRKQQAKASTNEEVLMTAKERKNVKKKSNKRKKADVPMGDNDVLTTDDALEKTIKKRKRKKKKKKMQRRED